LFAEEKRKVIKLLGEVLNLIDNVYNKSLDARIKCRNNLEEIQRLVGGINSRYVVTCCECKEHKMVRHEILEKRFDKYIDNGLIKERSIKALNKVYKCRRCRK